MWAVVTLTLASILKDQPCWVVQQAHALPACQDISRRLMLWTEDAHFAEEAKPVPLSVA